MENIYFYPAVLEKGEDGGWGLYFPDFPGTAVLHDDLTALAAEARSVLAFRIIELEESGQALPLPSEPSNIVLEDESARIVFLDVFMPPRRDEAANRSVSKNCTMPKWMRDAGDAAGLNYSLILQNGIKEALGIQKQ